MYYLWIQVFKTKEALIEIWDIPSFLTKFPWDSELLSSQSGKSKVRRWLFWQNPSSFLGGDKVADIWEAPWGLELHTQRLWVGLLGGEMGAWGRGFWGQYLRLRVSPDGASGKEPTCQCKRRRFDPWMGKIPWRRKWQPTPVFLPGESQWTEEPGGLQSIGSHRVRHDYSNLACTQEHNFSSPPAQTLIPYF